MKPKNHADVYGKRRESNVTVLNRLKPFNGKCETCGEHSDLRPYRADGGWICYDCAKKNPKAAENRMSQVLFGENLDS